MAHEMTENDNAVYHQVPAWHGLGVVVDEALTPVQAQELVLPWGVDQRPLFVDSIQEVDGRKRVVPEVVPTHVANYRDDTGELLGVVSSRYQVVSNQHMAEFCEALTEEVRCESVGSIRSGRKVWFLLKGEAFQIGAGDELFPYVLVSNSHDGTATFRVTPTTVRVVCSNTLHMVIPSADKGELKDSAISIKHTVNVMERVAEARKALAHYHRVKQDAVDMMQGLASANVNSEQVQKFFLECYTADFGAIPESPQDKHEERRRDRAMSAYNSFSRRFDDERGIAGASLWNAANAYSGLVQHDLKARGEDDEDRVEKRVASNLFGLGQQRTQAALLRAFRMSLAS